MYSLTGVIIICALCVVFVAGTVYVWMMDEPRHPREGWWTEGEPEEQEFE